MAGTIVKLIGDRVTRSGEPNKNFISLASRLGIKPESMIDSSLSDAMSRKHLHGPLCIMGFHLLGTNGLVPLLDGFEREDVDQFKKMPFNEWWNSSVVRDCRGNEFSRRVIVETMRDQEDAHTDGDLDAEYAEVAYNGAIGIVQIDKNSIAFDLNPARVVVRQIAHEVLRTFVPELPPRFIQTKGLKVKPLSLYEVMEKNEAGDLIPVLDRKLIEFRSESTSTPEIWQAWQQFVRDIPDDGQKQTPSKHEKSRDFHVRMIFLNYGPYPIEDCQAMLSMQSASVGPISNA